MVRRHYPKAVCSFPLQESFTDYPDPHVNAVVVYMAGCDHTCPGCQNQSLQKFDGTGLTSFTECGAPILMTAIIDACERYRTDKIVLLGGDPLASMNRDMTRWLCRELGEHYDICIYTGYDAKTVESFHISGFAYVKAGLFQATNARPSGKTGTCMTFASPNQDLYDKSMKKVSKNGILKFKKVS